MSYSLVATGTHGHSHGGGSHGHSHGEKGKHGHAHSDADSAFSSASSASNGENKAEEGENNHDQHHHERKFSLPSFNMNMKVVFLHQVGDSISSLFVLMTALLLYFFPDQHWIVYIDPIVRYLS